VIENIFIFSFVIWAIGVLPSLHIIGGIFDTDPPNIVIAAFFWPLFIVLYVLLKLLNIVQEMEDDRRRKVNQLRYFSTHRKS
jgi:hypothetical protein